MTYTMTKKDIEKNLRKNSTEDLAMYYEMVKRKKNKRDIMIKGLIVKEFKRRGMK